MKLAEKSTTISKSVGYGAEGRYTVVTLVRKAIGPRTMYQFCNDTGLSYGYVSRLLNGKLKTKPTVRTIAKIVHSSGDPEREELFKNLLIECGHDPDAVDIQKEIKAVEQTLNVIEDERKNDFLSDENSLRLKGRAVGLLFARLIAMGVNPQPVNVLGPNGGIEFRLQGFDYERVIAVPGFCGNNHQNYLSVERNILLQLLQYTSNYAETPLFLILTDSPDVYAYLSEVLDKGVCIVAYVLLADETRTKFIRQCFCAADGKADKDIFNFIEEQ